MTHWTSNTCVEFNEMASSENHGFYYPVQAFCLGCSVVMEQHGRYYGAMSLRVVRDAPATRVCYAQRCGGGCSR
jgi:hypothetical protein